LRQRHREHRKIVRRGPEGEAEHTTKKYTMAIALPPNQLSIVAGAMIIGAAIVGAQFFDRYQIAPAVGADGNPFAWRLDTRTGEIKLCRIRSNLPTQGSENSSNPYDKIGPPILASGQSPVTVVCLGNTTSYP
jgi:hypothetical protein